ncbi:MAG TPA: hypothetical protein DEO91_11455 [Pseudomonas sp.]|nr:hypothetical protein [Pseudomonas sp.]
MATASDLQQLYIGYFGRAADQAGLDFWVEAINNGGLSLANVHTAFVQSAEYTAKYEGLSSEALVAQVYLNVLGRPAEAEGKAFWANAIDTGVITQDQLIEGLLSGLSAGDKAIVNNKVTVANYYTAHRGADFNADDITTSGTILAPVDGSTASVSTGLKTIVDTVPASAAASGQVVAALNNYLAAVKAEEDFAKTVIDPTTKKPVVDNNSNGHVDEANTAATAAQTAAFTKADTAVQAASTVTLNASDAAAVTAAKLAQASTEAANAVTAAQAAVDAKAGLNAAVRTFESAKASYDAAYKNMIAASNELTAERAKFGVIDAAGNGGAYDAATGVLAGVTKLDQAGKLILDPLYAEPAKTPAQIAAANAVLEDIKAHLAAVKAEDTANTAVDNAAAQLVILDNTTAYDSAQGTNALTAGLAFTLSEEKKQQADLAKAIPELSAANETVKKLSDLDTAKTTADNAVDKVLSGGLVAVTGGASVGTTKTSELFVVDAAKLAIGATATVAIEKGDFLFIGNGYVKGTDSDAITAGIQGGNDSALEVFFATNAGNTVVTVEKTAFGSSADTAEVVEITLTGVTADQLAFDAQTGLITIA